MDPRTQMLDAPDALVLIGGWVIAAVAVLIVAVVLVDFIREKRKHRG